MTKIRKTVLDLVTTSSVPLSAGTIYEQLVSQKRLKCNLASVYRTLKYLELEHLAGSFILHCEAHGTERYFYANKQLHTHWFHCSVCHRFFDIGNAVTKNNHCIIDKTAETIQTLYGFSVEQHSLLFTGTCKDCIQSQKHNFILMQ
ncbi:MAG TPA: transcriptional repressor [Spirochaetales bacterium]|nr:transcriptional repressor [Spirochaetales bacterium]HOT59190.1 transcriptional repressor [Spirochaetales bacterium]HQG40021.1 transcriptional repressor [Spirochaetales bacterium]HQK35561.1 transcriptional repressor [Spirochaetales bacterium]